MTRKLLISTTAATAAVVAAVAVAGTALAADGRGGYGMHRGRDGHPLFGILLLVAVAGLAILGTWLVLGRRRGSTAPATVPAAASTAVPPAAVSPTANAEAILAERLARSEISPDEYRAALAVMREVATSPAAEPGPLPPPDAG